MDRYKLLVYGNCNRMFSISGKVIGSNSGQPLTPDTTCLIACEFDRL